MKEASPYKNRYPPLSFWNFACTAPPVIKFCMVLTFFCKSTGEYTDRISPELEVESREDTSYTDLAR